MNKKKQENVVCADYKTCIWYAEKWPSTRGGKGCTAKYTECNSFVLPIKGEKLRENRSAL